jgi:nucleotide-binding universal stress UspA family protein
VKYLVPFDFTPITRNALEHALFFSKSDSEKIVLLHIIEKEGQKEAAIKKFTDLITGLPEADQARIKTKIRQGDIYTDIAKEAKEGDFKLLVMGTHGEKGLQRILGSNAMKVITSCNIPFIVTQSKPPKKSVNRIVLPIDLSGERWQIATFASDLAQKFQAEVFLVHAQENDPYLVKRINNNIKKVKRVFKQKGIAFTISVIKSKKSWAKEVMAYGESINTDLFAIGYYPSTLLPQFERFSQDLITNPQETPVLITNVEEIAGVRTNYSFVGI